MGGAGCDAQRLECTLLPDARSRGEAAVCGIAGFVNLAGADVTQSVLAMLAPVHHRGPDGEGLYHRGQVTLGHRRLAVLDLSADAAQPMEREGVTLVFNGEIYNYVELRRELVGRGRKFITNSDTEVLLVAYLEWGLECLSRFDGMWAFALHDVAKDYLILSRDRFGEKPLVYSRRNGDLIFASEIRQLRAVGLRDTADSQTVLEYLTMGRQADAAATFYSGVRNVPAGHNMLVNLGSGTVEERRYYSPGASRLFEGATVAEIPDLFAEEFRRAVTTRLRSDVPLGVLLSGGIDSSLIAAVAAEVSRSQHGRTIPAITALSTDPSNDEREYARDAAESARLEWWPFEVPPDVTSEGVERATDIAEQPLGSASIVLQMEVMRRAHESGLTVLLDGQGADESWLGYPRYMFSVVRELPWRRRPRYARLSARNAGFTESEWLQHFLYFQFSGLSTLRNHHRARSIGLQVSRPWLKGKMQDSIVVSGKSTVDMQRGQLHGEQLAHLLRYADRNSMAFSVEDRLPYLDHRLVELALAVPAEVHHAGGWSKWVLRNELARWVSPKVAWRTGKIGFEAHAASFDRNSSQVRSTVAKSAVLAELGVGQETLAGASSSVAWRLFSTALWEETASVGPGPAL